MEHVRKVLIVFRKNFISGEKPTDKELVKGYFHEWASCGNESEGIEKYALVETEDGLVHEVQTHKIKFIEPIKE